MNVHLIGGGWDDTLAKTLYGEFIEEAARYARGQPRILLVLMGTDDESRSYHEKYVATLGLVGHHELVVERVAADPRFDPSALERVDGIFVGGGPTPDYHASLAPTYALIRELVHAGMPYAGFSAGAAIAGTHAIIGGWRVDGVPVCPEESNENIQAVTVVPGIGLVEGAIDVHAAQWGNVSRLLAVVEAGLAPGGIAIDELTALTPGDVVVGRGCVWRVDRIPPDKQQPPAAGPGRARVGVCRVRPGQ